MFGEEKTEKTEKEVKEKKPSPPNKKIRIDEFVLPQLPKYAREVLKAHLKKVVGSKGTEEEYKNAFDNFMKREIK